MTVSSVVAFVTVGRVGLGFQDDEVTELFWLPSAYPRQPLVKVSAMNVLNVTIGFGRARVQGLH